MKRVLVLILVLSCIAVFCLLVSCQKSINATSPEPESTVLLTATITQTVTITPTVTNTATATPTNTPIITKYSFPSDLEGWYRDVMGMGFTSVAHNTDPEYSALGTTGSAQANCNFYSPMNLGYMSRDYSPTINLDGKTIKAYIYVPSSLAVLSPSYYAHIQIHSLAGGYTFGGAIDLDTEGWNLMQWAPAGIGVNEVDRVTIVVGRTAPNDWSGVVYIDEISYE